LNAGASAAPPRVLSIAGSDSGGGAGIQADLKTFAAHGVYGATAVTAVTAQDTRGVRAMLPVPAELVAAQIDAVLGDIGADAIKIGMLATAETVRAVAERLRFHLPAMRRARLAGSAWAAPGPLPVPVVLDPVMAASDGSPLLAGDGCAALLDELVPLATLATPNLPELERLAGGPAGGETARRAAAERLAARGPAVLAKGGHDEAAGGGAEVVDLLVVAGEGCRRFAHPRLATAATHGTGCTLSAAIAARLAAGDELAAAVAAGIAFLQGALAAAYPLGRGSGPVDPLFRLRGVAPGAGR
jgi:hydroxymethylpyrimidine/phosphomethylpyrimidine kinase